MSTGHSGISIVTVRRFWPASLATSIHIMASRVWLITGCSSGFGLELARTILACGDRLIASSRNSSKNAAVVDEIKSSGGHWISLDVTDSPQTISRIVTEAASLFGRIDFLVNNGGFGTCGGFEDFT